MPSAAAHRDVVSLSPLRSSSPVIHCDRRPRLARIPGYQRLRDPDGRVPSLDDAMAIDTTAYIVDEPHMRIERSRREPGTYFFAFADGTRFRLHEYGRVITTSWQSTREDMSTYLVGPVLAFVVRLRGTLA